MVEQDIRNIIGAEVQGLRIERGLTQEELAEKAGLTPANIRAIEGGRYGTTIDVLYRIANALDVKIALV